MTGHRTFAALAFAAVVGAAIVGPARAEDKVYAKVDGQPITESEVATMTASLAQQLASLPEDARRRAVVDRLVDLRLIVGAANKAGLDKSDSFKARMDQIRSQLLVGEFVKVKVEAAVTPEMIKARYDKDAAAYTPPEELHARHILVKTKEEAQAIIVDLDKGGDFAKIAEEKSQDPGSAKQGGDLGFFGPGDMVPEFDKAAGALAVGAITKEPVQTQFGFHVIKLEEKRKQPLPALDQVQDQVRQAVVGELFTSKLDELKKASKIEIDEAAIKAK
ncbi:peptidylprolyl isomerase [Siculibacillus lacustris]|nr:peptidylprolyl isomerase [Siculibacillus lacustris]